MITFVAPVAMPSPCIGICRLDTDDACEGCRRTRDEIARWTAMAPAERDAVMVRVTMRR